MTDRDSSTNTDWRAPIAVALDAPDRATALAWAAAVAPHVQRRHHAGEFADGHQRAH